MEAWFMPPHRFIGTHKSTLASWTKTSRFLWAWGLRSDSHVMYTLVPCACRLERDGFREGSRDILFPEDLPVNLRSSG